MPTYQYACTACGHQLEAVQSFADDPLTECPACQGRLRKLFSAVGIVFKGSGFYRTDSRSGSTSANGSSANGAQSNGSSANGAPSNGKSADGGSASGTSDSSTGGSGTKKTETTSPASSSGS